MVSSLRSVATDVLSTRELWDAITASMTGYPLVVTTLLRCRDLHAALQVRIQSTITDATHHFAGDLTRRGVLPHLAIAATDAPMLRMLFQLTKHPQYARDARLSFKRAMRCAVLFNSVSMLQCIEELRRDDDPSWTWSAACEPHLMRIALQRADVDVRVLEWLAARLSRRDNALFFVKDMQHHAREGNLAIVVWLREHGCKITQAAVDGAARNGQTRVLEYLYAHSRRRCQSAALCDAADIGFLDVVMLAVRSQKNGTGSRHAVNSAALAGHLDIVTFLVESGAAGSESHPIDDAAVFGHLDIVRYLDAHLPGGCTRHAMSVAAANGHLDVVRYLHESRTEGCFDGTLTQTVYNGHLEVARYLRAHYPQLECASYAIDKAVSDGNHQLVKLVCESFGNRKPVAEVLAMAVKKGRVGVVACLSERHSEGAIPTLLESAAQHGHLEIVKLLHAKLRMGESAFGALDAASCRSRREIVAFLCEHEVHEARSFLQQAVESGAVGVVRVLLRRSSLAQLVEARDQAAVLGRPSISDLLTRVLEGRRRQSEGRDDSDARSADERCESPEEISVSARRAS